MALGKNSEESSRNSEKKTYFSISHGQVVQGGERKQYYSYIEGCIAAIYKRHSNFGGEDVLRWYIDIRDGGELYSICLPYSSGVFKSIILSLASVEALSPSTLVRIEPYQGRNGYTKIVTYANGAKLDWVTKQLPPQETAIVGGKQVKDDSKQMEYICSLCETIKERLQKNEGNI